jgi:malate dehydrogenase
VKTVAILGGGELAAALARRVAEAELARCVVLVDPNEGRAKGKALDIAQSGPVEGFDARVEAAATLEAVVAPDVVVIADPDDLADAVLLSTRGAERIAAWLPAVGKATLLVAGPHPSPLVEAAVAKGFPRDRVLGSSPVAAVAALRRRLSAELHVEPREIAAAVLGLPPSQLAVPQAAVTVSGLPVEKVAASAIRRALGSLGGRPPGPVALAAAALRVLRALEGDRATMLPVVAYLDGEYGHRRVALSVPARLRSGRIESVVEVALDPVDRVAFDNAADRRRAGQV